MLETYFTQKFHFSSEIQVMEVGKPWIFHGFQANPLCNLHRGIRGNHHFLNFDHMYLRAEVEFLSEISF